MNVQLVDVPIQESISVPWQGAHTIFWWLEHAVESTKCVEGCQDKELTCKAKN